VNDLALYLGKIRRISDDAVIEARTTASRTSQFCIAMLAS